MNMQSDNSSKKYPKGHFVGQWIGIGMAIFSGLGIPISIATGSYAFMGIGPAIGVSVGVAIGQSIENKKEKEGLIRPLTEAEQRNRKLLTLAGVFILAIGVVLFVTLYLNR